MTKRIGPYTFAGVYKRRDNGRWAFNYREGTKRRAKMIPADEARTEKQAERWAKQELRRMVAVYERGEGEITTVAQFLDAWLQRRQRNPRVRRATAANNGGHIAHYIKPQLGHLDLDDLRPRRVRDWLCKLRDEGNLAANSLRNIVATLKKALDAAVDEDLLPSNPARAGIVKDELPAAEHVHDVVVLQREAAELLCTSSAVPEDRRVRWLVALTTGLREGELQGLTWGDVDLDGDVPLVDVRQSYSVRCSVGALKTSSARRRVPLHPESVKALKAFRREVWAVLVGRFPRNEDAVFPNAEGGHCRPRSAEHIRRDLKACGCSTEIAGKAITAHSTRRTFATMLAEAEVDEGLRRRLMGHSGASVTDRHYTAKSLARLAEAVARIELALHRAEVIELKAASGA